MEVFNVHDAKTQFSRILAKVQAGEEVVIAKAGEPIAKVVPIRHARVREPDSKLGLLWIAEDFDGPLPDEVLDAFEGRP